MEFTIKRVIAFLVMFVGILGSIITFLVVLPTSHTIESLIASLTVLVALILAIIKMLQEMSKTVEKEVEIRANSLVNGRGI